MFKKPFIINNDGKIFIFPKNTVLNEQQIQVLESRLRQFSTSINYSEEVHEFDFDIYSIWSLLVMGENMLEDFISFLEDNSVNELPQNLYDSIQEQKNNFKQVLLKEELENIIIKVLRGDLESLIKKTLKKEVKFDEKRNVYISPKSNSSKIAKNLLKNEVSVKLDNYLENVDSITLDFKCTFDLRYYQKEAIDFIIKTKQESGIIFMPPGSGKSYIALKLIEYLKVPTLIICNNSEEYWEEFIFSNTTNMNENYVSIHKGDNILTPITICSYHMAKDNIIKNLKQYPWGIVFYDDSHRALADKYSETLYIKSKYKFALAATLNRGDGKGYQLYDIIGPKLYNITWQELKNRRFYKNINYKMIISKKYDKVKVCKRLVDQYKGRNILICSHDKKIGGEISNILKLTYLNGDGHKDIKDMREREQIEKFMAGHINIICISSILQRLQISNIDVLIALTHNGRSEPEEIFRIGRAASCFEQTKIPCTTEFYSIVTDEEKKHFYKRLKSVKQYIHGPDIIDDTAIMEGDY